MKPILKNKGMTLLEVVLAITLLAIVMTPLANLFIDSLRFQSRNQKLTRANEVVEYVIECFKNGLATDLVDGVEHELTLKQFYQKIGSTTDKDYKIKIESEKTSEEVTIEGDLLEEPASYQGTVTITPTGLKYEGDMGVVIDDKTIIINSGYTDNNLLIKNENNVYVELKIRNLTNKEMNVYKVNSVSLEIIDGAIFQANIEDTHQNKRYSIYNVKVTATEKNDDSIYATIKTAVKVAI